MFKYDYISKINGLPRFRTDVFFMMLPHLRPADENDVMITEEQVAVRRLIEESEQLFDRFENAQQYDVVVAILTKYRVACSKTSYERYDVRSAAKWLKTLEGKDPSELKALYDDRPLPSGQTGGLNQLNFQYVIRYLLNPRLLAPRANDEEYAFEELEWVHIKKKIFEEFDFDGEIRKEIANRLDVSLKLMKNHNNEVTTRLSDKQIVMWRDLYSVLDNSTDSAARIDQKALIIELCMLFDPQVSRNTDRKEYTDRVRKVIRRLRSE